MTGGAQTIGVIGTGRVARALAGALGPGVALWGRSPEALEGACAATRGLAMASPVALLDACDTVLIAVADAALPQVVAQLAAQPTPHRPLVAHVSGASGIAVLKPLHGADIAAIHPVMTFTGDPVAEAARMAGARFAITGADAVAEARARTLVARLGGIAVPVAEAQRALYHAGLSHAANHLVTLIAGAGQILSAAGISDPGAMLAPLVRAALENSLAAGFAALSGPVLRDDRATVAAHLAALARDCPDALPAYRAMAQATAATLARDGRDNTAIRALLDTA